MAPVCVRENGRWRIEETHPCLGRDRAFEILGLPLVLAISALWDWWTDPRLEFTETITLNLTQSQNSVTGSIVDERGGEWRIIEGVISDNQVNLFYDRDFPAWPGAGATLVGK